MAVARGVLPKLIAVIAVTVVVILLYVYWVADYLRYEPPTATASTTSATSANLTMQTVGTLGYGEHPTWVSYLIRNANGKWLHTTVVRLPANATIHVTVYEYDSAGALRNPFIGLVNKTQGNVEYVNGKPQQVVDPLSDPAHTFTVPSMGVSVPLFGVPATAKNTCAVAPCTTNFAHETDRFTFHTGAAGVYRWQCFVPCGLGFLYGNGGPMSTLGYMGGFLDVVKA